MHNDFLKLSNKIMNIIFNMGIDVRTELTKDSDENKKLEMLDELHEMFLAEFSLIDNESDDLENMQDIALMMLEVLEQFIISQISDTITVEDLIAREDKEN